MVIGCSEPVCKRASVSARKRAPKSLKAAVGPWNNSRTKSGFGHFGTVVVGAGKSSAAPGAGYRTSEGAGRHGAALHLLETRDQGMTLRLDDHVVEGVANHLQIV